MTPFKQILLLSALVLSWSTPTFADQGFADTLEIHQTNLQLNGHGKRKKAFIKVYEVALYLPEKSSDPAAIVAADAVQAIDLVVTSKLASAKKISAAFNEGINKATNNQTEAITQQIAEFLGVFATGVTKGDRFVFAYQPGDGVSILKNGASAAQIEGMAFKQALFGIWLSDQPVTEKLKTALLGG